MKLDIAALTDSIQRNVIPQLPDELKEDELTRNFSQLLAKLVIADNDTKRKFVVTMKQDLDELIGSLRELITYLSTHDIGDYVNSQAMELMSLGNETAISTSLCLLFKETLREVEELLKGVAK